MTTATATADTELRIERLIAAPPEKVFALWTDPKLLVQWWGPQGYAIPELAIDLRPGGHWTTTMRNTEGKLITVNGVYRVIEPPRRLVFTWAWLDDDGARGHETEIALTFESAPGGTRMVFLQRAFQDKDGRDRHNFGWSSSFVKLERMVA